MAREKKARSGPIGIFDSGVGGLSVLRALEEALPQQSYMYYGDTARVPYGDRQSAELRQFTLEIGSWLMEQGCSAVLIACHTSTVSGGEALAAALPIPVYGMMEAVLAGGLAHDGEASEASAAAAQAATALQDVAQPLGMIATQGTADSGVYQRAFAQAAPGRPFFMQACPSFVPLIEKGCLSGQEVERAVETYLAPLQERGITTLVLGCTHYPFLLPVIRQYLGPGVRIVDPAIALAALLKKELLAQGALPALPDKGEVQFYCSGNTASFTHLCSRLLGRPLKEAERWVF